jgi:hypothetical protein
VVALILTLCLQLSNVARIVLTDGPNGHRTAKNSPKYLCESSLQISTLCASGYVSCPSQVQKLPPRTRMPSAHLTTPSYGCTSSVVSLSATARTALLVTTLLPV